MSLLLVMVVYVSSFVLVLGFEEWFLVWLGLEINMMSFLVIIYQHQNVLVSEAVGKYFFIQSLGSGVFLAMIYLGWNIYLMDVVFSMKLGLGPFYYWYVSVVKMISWESNVILMTIQSVLPFMLLGEIISWVVWMVSGVSLVIGVLGSFNQMSLSGLMAFSSVHHGGWMLACLVVSDYLWLMYLVLYSVLLVLVLGVLKMMEVQGLGDIILSGSSKSLVVLVLVLGGIPPFMGFILKWVSFLFFVEFDYWVVGVMVLMSLGMLYVYLRMVYNVVVGSWDGFGWMVSEWSKGGAWEGMMIISVLSMGLLMIFL